MVKRLMDEGEGETPADVAALLRQWSGGDAEARDKLIPLVYNRLRELAHQRRGRGNVNISLTTTAIVHETYIHLVAAPSVNLYDRAHFLALAGQIMRNLLIDHARARQAAKRGGGAVAVELEDASFMADSDLDAIVELHEALEQADARANAWLAAVESPLGFVPPAAEEVSVPPNVDGQPSSRVDVTRRRWLLVAVSVVALGGGGVALVSEIAQRASTTNANWNAPSPAPAIAPNRFNLVAVNLHGEERPLVDVRNAGSWSLSALDTGYFAWPKISPDGKRIAVEVRTGDQRWDIWIYDLTLRDVTRLTHDFTGVRPFGWSPDSRNLIYLGIDDQNINGPQRVVSQRWDGSAPPRQLLRTDFPIHDIALGPLD